MLSKSSVKLLKWMNENDDWMYYHEIEKSCPGFEYRDIKALKVGNYIDADLDDADAAGLTEYDDPIMFSQYRINSSGKAYLESRVTDIIDKSITRTISVVALVISLIALLSQLGILKLQAG